MSDLNEIVGKVVVKVDHIDNFDGGIVITFSDGTSLAVTEYAQTGKLDVSYHNEVSTKPTVQEWVDFAEQTRAKLALDILNDADVMQEFDDEVWVQIDKDSWKEFNGDTDDEEDEDA
jgi:hypothetical protein